MPPAHDLPLSPTPPASPADTAARPHSLSALFLAFTLLALQGFGGVLAVAQRDLVDRRRWLTAGEFVEAFSVAQLLPGPNVVNLSLMVGDRFFGWRGALVALGGILALPLLLVLALAASYRELAQIPEVAGALRGMGAVAAGLILAMAIKMRRTLRGNLMGPWLCAAFGLTTVLAVAVFRVPLPWIVFGLGSVAWLIAYLCITHARGAQK